MGIDYSQKKQEMRKRFEQQKTLDATLISEVEIDGKSRDEFPKLLAGLQYIFITPDLNEAIFKILEEKVLSDKQVTGCPGMSLWEIFVLGVTRLNMDMDYDRLRDTANHHIIFRGILGVDTKEVFSKGKIYPLQTLKDNVRLLDEATLSKINEVVVKAGHQLKKNEDGVSNDNEENIELRLKTDTYVAEANIHFPTDIWLLWCSGRKCLDMIDHIVGRAGFSLLPGWRKSPYLRKILKRRYLKCSNIHRKKGKNYDARLKTSVKVYLSFCRNFLLKKLNVSETALSELSSFDPLLSVLVEQLSDYKEMLIKHIDLVERRIIKGEKIPHSEKLFSIFERHAEWISKGKEHKKVELGHNVLVTTDQWGFMVDHKTIFSEPDTAQVQPLTDRLQQNFVKEGGGYVVKSHSFDRGFYSSLNEEYLEKFVAEVIMPKPGYKSAARKEEENTKTFVALRNKHSAVESSINELEHTGVNRIPDKGEEGFKRYVAYGVVAFNLKRLGALVIKQELLETVFVPESRRSTPKQKRAA